MHASIDFAPTRWCDVSPGDAVCVRNVFMLVVMTTRHNGMLSSDKMFLDMLLLDPQQCTLVTKQEYEGARADIVAPLQR